jgi:ABC-type phosphate/phosphonate transport system substrate-binding protein
MRMSNQFFGLVSYVSIAIACYAVILVGTIATGVEPYGPENAKITIVVMDPMSLPLACDCVQGYAQRRYEKLADYLNEKLRTTTRVVWAESLETASAELTRSQVTIVIGKDSVVRADATKAKSTMIPIAQLTDTKGSVMQYGLFVVRNADKAASLLDIENYRVLWGPDDCDEKSKAPRAKLKELEIEATDGGVCNSCSIAAKKLMAETPGTKTVAVISSYAEPLLAGCGSIKKGDLRVVGQSDEVPFVSAFVSESTSADERAKITVALLEMNKSEEMLKSLETRDGFLAYSVKP